ncbi:response regulator transcription factor [Nocardioides sp.]|uniref:response regulator transcription factor n=1 Tax=Nocardioides sp. TaxID=35761 RepID=UPI00286DB4A0|nr:response regulator transcription factor [Nocardioides sp.]
MSKPATKSIRVLVVDDDPLVRSALALMLGGQPDLVLVGEAGDGAEALVMVERERPQVVLMDIRMPVMNGLDATKAVLQLAHAPSVIVLTTFHADAYVVAAVAAGADGFLLKDTPPHEIVSAVRRVADGEAMLSPAATRAVLEQMRLTQPLDRSAVAKERMATLTLREREVAICVGRGLSNADIAGELYLSVPTVKAHVSRLFDKLHSTNRVQIAMVVHDAGLV